MKVINTMDWGEIGKGLSTIFGMLILITGFMWAFAKVVQSQGTNLLMAAGAVTTVATAILILAGAVVLISIVPADYISNGLGIMAVSLLAVAAFLWALQKANPINMVAGAGAFALIAAGLVLVGLSLLLIAAIPSEKLAGSVIALLVTAGVLTTIVGMLAAMELSGQMALAGAAMVLMSASLVIMAAAVKLMATMPWQQAGAAILLLAGAFAVFGAAAAIAGAAWELLLPGAGILIAIGVAAGVLAVAIHLLGDALGALAKGLTAILKLLLMVGVAFINLISMITFGIEGSKGKLITLAELTGEQFGDSFADGLKASDTSKAAEEFVEDTADNVNSASSKTAPDAGMVFDELFANGMLDSQDYINNAAFENVGNISDIMSDSGFAGSEFMEDYLKDYESKFGDLQNMGYQASDLNFEALMSHSGDFEASGMADVQSYVDGYTSNVSLTNVSKAAEKLTGTIVESSDGETMGETIGKQIVRGIGEGLLESKTVNSMLGNAGGVIDLIFNRMKKKARSASPSKRARDDVGKWIPLGVAEGLLQYSAVSTAAAGTVTDGIFDSLSDALSSTDSFINDNLTLDPTITPLMDMSKIQNGVGEINSLLGGSNFNVNGTLGRLSMANAGILNALGGEIMGRDKSSQSIVNAINSLKGDVKSLGEYVNGLEIRMDSGALVGSIAAPMDKQLGVRAMRSRRERPR